MQKVLSIDGGIIPAMVLTEIDRRGPWFFKRRHARDKNREGDNFLMRDVAKGQPVNIAHRGGAGCLRMPSGTRSFWIAMGEPGEP
jgi:hypothetical protein